MNDIQQKLDLIDKQLSGSDFHKRLISTSPLVFAAVGLIVGILIQNTFDLSLLLWLILLTLCAVGAFIFFAIQRFTFNNQSSIINNQFITAYLSLACFLCLGAIRLANFHQPKPNDIRNLVGSERTLATIRGRIIAQPYTNENRNWKFAKFTHTDPQSSFYLKLKESETTCGWVETTGTIRVQVAEPVPDFKTGDYIQAYCWLGRFKPATNPGQFNIAEYMAGKNIYIAANIKSRDGIKLLGSNTDGIFTKIKSRLRQTATYALLGDTALEENNQGLLEALLLGYRGNIDSDTYLAFRKTGLLHFISLSGMHLGILAGIIWWLCKTAGLLKPARAIVCIIAVYIFLLIVPPRAPTLRAAIICFVFCLSILIRRQSNPLNSLSLAAIILLLIRPTDLFGAGWQLSFASVLGIILFTDRIEGFLYEKVTEWFRLKETQKTKGILSIIPDPRSLFAIGFAAWLGSAGILLYHFYTISPFTCIWTVLVFPLVAGILTVGFLKILISLLLPSAAVILGIILNGLTNSLIWIVKLIASLNISELLIGKVNVAVIIFYYCLIVFIGFVYLKRPLLKKAICIAAVLSLFSFLGVTKWQRTHQDNLTLTVLNVGHGQAILAQLPGRANILFDAGSQYNKDIGRRVVTPFLRYSGINKLDAIIISHDDTDHINGIPEIVEGCRVNDVYATSAFLSKTKRRGTAKFLKNCLAEKNCKIQPLGRQLNSGSDAKVKILWPTEEMCRDDSLGDNDKSIVCLIEFAGKAFLLCSDIQNFAQREILKLYPGLKADIVVIPHHGSISTTEPGFLKSLNANILVCSCGRRYYEKQQQIQRDNEAKFFYTVNDGAVAIRIDKNGTIHAETFCE